MNRPPPHSATREDLIPAELLRARHFSPRQLRLLRKEVLLLRAAVERAEIAGASAELRHRLAHFGWLKWLAPSWAGGKIQLGGVGSIIKQYPLISSLTSLVMSSRVRHTAASLVKPAAKIGVLAFAAWSAWKVWRSIQTEQAEPKAAAANPAAAASDAQD